MTNAKEFLFGTTDKPLNTAQQRAVRHFDAFYGTLAFNSADGHYYSDGEKIEDGARLTVAAHPFTMVGRMVFAADREQNHGWKLEVEPGMLSHDQITDAPLVVEYRDIELTDGMRVMTTKQEAYGVRGDMG
ncbi:hypothetical protein [Lacticaseibacillus parakribbianus]|uniref:hypothetical protein n=1 Tax=Lacticaseibacillus parakribbianus TaxID=2970927 RepID=UPI0021CB7F36|nr:hypothetical protein [Lacticaseibacillus parakribbianus]